MAEGARAISGDGRAGRNVRGGETPDRHVEYLVQYAAELLKHLQADQDQEELIEAQELAEKVKVLRPDSLDLLMLEAHIQKARNEIGKAVELIEAGADRPKLPPGDLLRLSMLAEEFGQPELAERLLKKLASQQDRLEYRLPLVRFLAVPVASGTPSICASSSGRGCPARMPSSLACLMWS